ELLIYPRSVLVAVSEITAELAAHVRTALRDSNIAEQSLACLLASEEQMANALLHQAASELDVPVRFDKAGSASEMASSRCAATAAAPQRRQPTWRIAVRRNR
ncbi:hypothetical protein CU663_05290, partial [Pseudomonas syringae pv. actinidifoliorum]|nr:hypothetical protein [Pseudomonas syringae pv. actinidifoliorum]